MIPEALANKSRDTFKIVIRKLLAEQGDQASGPFLCLAPACGQGCSGCNRAISPQQQREYARRYAYLRENDPRFGMPTDWLGFPTLDEAIDADIAATTARAEG